MSCGKRLFPAIKNITTINGQGKLDNMNFDIGTTIKKSGLNPCKTPTFQTYLFL